MTAIVVGSLMFVAGVLDAVAFLQSRPLLGVLGVVWAAAAAVLVVVSIRRLRRAQPRRN